MPQTVIVLGAGVVGLSLARELSRRSVEVDLLDSRHCGSGASLAATGVLKAPPHTSTPFFQLRQQGWEHWPVLAAELEQETGIEVGYHCCGGIDIRDATQRDPQRAVAALPQIGGEVRVLSATDLEQLLPTVQRRLIAGLFIEHEARVDPKALIGALRQSCLQSGVRIHEQLGPIVVEPRDADGIALVGQLPPQLEGRHGFPVVLAAGWESATALLDMPPAPLPLDPVRGEAIALDIPAPPHIVTFDAKQDSIQDEAGNRSRFSWIPAPDGKSWLGNSVGTEQPQRSPSAQPTELGLEQLLAAAQSLFGDSVRKRVIDHWAGIRPKAMRHGGPLLGRWPGRPQLWVATGHYRTGLLVGPTTARMMAEAMLDGVPIPQSFSIPD
ncbi:MAG: FAD-dependent oxidoreductase [Planctomycetota bacterium]|nr:FAD-dependent oxidoreductase [Planctomycetota bacterium]